MTKVPDLLSLSRRLPRTVTMTFLNWQSRPGAEQTRVEILRPTPTQSGQIEVIDGDTVRFNGVAYRLVGIDTPERPKLIPVTMSSGDRATEF